MNSGDQQLELFPEEPHDHAAWRRAEALAARQPAGVHFGTSSWNFRGWHGLVYHKRYRSEADFRRRSLWEYARYPLFRTVGLDRSYYAPLSAGQWAHYASLLPDGFRVCTKVWSRVSRPVIPNHPAYGESAGRENPCFLDPDLFREQVAEPMSETFSAHMGPLILQLSRVQRGLDCKAFVERLERFLRRAPEGFRFAIELRNRELLSRRYFDMLRHHGASHVFNFWSAMPGIGEQVRRAGETADSSVVIRLLLPHGARYDVLRERYAPFDRIVCPQEPMRREVVDLIQAARQRASDVFVIVNNKAEGSAPQTVGALAAMLVGEEPDPAPL